MIPLRHVTLLAIGAAVVSVGWTTMREPASPTAAASSPPRAKTTRWQGLAVPVPAGWQRAEAAPDVGVWQGPGGETLTVATAPRSAATLDAVAGGVAKALPAELPGVEVEQVGRVGERDDTVTIRFAADTGDSRIRGQQLWHRPSGGTVDTITTWTTTGTGSLRGRVARPL